MTFVRVKNFNGDIQVGKVLCLARNYAAHAKEMGAKAPERLTWFLKPATALLPDGGDIVVPPGIGAVHHEVELAALIGARVKDVPEEQALECVLAYAVLIDVTARDVQKSLKEQGLPWGPAKGLDTFAPVSRATLRAEVGDPQDLELGLKVNGEVRQKGTTANMLRPVARVIAELSKQVTLLPGDLVATGTPEGVGPLVPGDVVEASISRVGSLKCRVVAAR